MEIDQECKPHIPTMVTVNGNDNCEKKISESQASLSGQADAAEDHEHIEVDIVSFTNGTQAKSVKAEEDPDATDDYSSSFTDTDSDVEKRSGPSETEAESHFFGDSDFASPFDAFSCIFTRKKKLTNHWRNFIRPLMWRCKWTELKIKEIESQAIKYKRQLEAYQSSKHSGAYSSTSEGFCSKLLPFTNQWYRRQAKKRRKRKRVEDMTGTTSYTSSHTIFCYLENKRSSLDNICMLDDFSSTATVNPHVSCNDKIGMDNDQLQFEFGDGDNSLERILWKIEVVHSRVHKLKNQLDLMMTKNSAKFSSFENLSLLIPSDGRTSSAPSPTFSAGNGETLSVGAINSASQHISGYEIGDVVMHESTMSNYGETIHVPDIIESTVGLLSAVDVTFHQPQIGDACEDIVDNILIKTEAAEGEGEGHALIGTSNQLKQKLNEAEKGEEGESSNAHAVPATETEGEAKPAVVTWEQSSLNSCLASDIQFPRNKRKRGERKAGSGGWNKKSAGDHDSQ